jgi:hypothetical protein
MILSLSLGAGLLPALIHPLILLIVLAIVYYIIAWVLGQIGAPAVIGKLVLILCAVIALFWVITFLLGIA